MDATGDRLYWVKIRSDFFARIDIRLVEAEPDGDKYLLFYLKLLFKFAEKGAEVNCSVEELADMTRCEPSTVRGALDVLTKYEVISRTSDGRYFLNDYINGNVCVVSRSIRDRGGEEYRVWRLSVFRRDDFTCQKCGKRGDWEAHHIVQWVVSKELRYDVDNGITLCKSCHKKEHKHRVRRLVNG